MVSNAKEHKIFWVSRCALLVLSLNYVQCMEFNYCQISPSHTLCQYAVSCFKTHTHGIQILFDKLNHISSNIKFHNIMIFSRDLVEHALHP